MTAADLDRVPPFYHNYIRQVGTDNLEDAFTVHQALLMTHLSDLTEEQWEYRYAEGKWSVKEVVQHIIDAERIFGYRALCLARGETVSLPGFDENAYAARSKADERRPTALLDELEAVQRSTALLFRSFDEEQLEASGISNGKSMYVRAIGFICVGHARHHLNILQERYGI